MTFVSASPSRRIYGVVGLLIGASFLNSLDRQTLSVLKPTIKDLLTLDDSGYAVLVNIFTFCYAGAYMASGWMVDRLGNRVSLSVFLSGWSVATIGCGLSRSFGFFAGCRALLGLAEPGLFPVSIRAMTLWVPSQRRGLIMNLAGLGSPLGAIVAPLLITWLALTHSWHAAFVVPGLAGLLLAAGWWLFYRDPVHVVANTVAGATAPALPWGKLWRQRSLWGIVLARFVSDPVWYFCLFWMPGYFQERKGLTLAETGIVGWIPFFAASLGAIGCAMISDTVARRTGAPVAARKRVLLMIALAGPLAIATPYMPGIASTIVLLSLVGIVCQGWFGVLGPLITDAFPPGNVGSVWGIAGAFGATGAMIFNYSIGQITTALGTEHMFLILGFLHPIAAGLIFALVGREPKFTASS